MDIVLRIFFSGLMAFAPSKDGRELTVLLVNTPHAMTLADGTPLPHHMPMLLARAASCEPAPCPARDPQIAQFLFSGIGPERQADALQSAVLGGAAWQLASSDLTLTAGATPLEIRTKARRRSSVVPATPAERTDFSWVPHLSAISPQIGDLKPELLSDHPPASLVAARLRLRSGSVITYSLVRIDAKARPVHFRPSGGGSDVPFAQAVANWVEAEIHIPADAVEVTDTNFETGATRTIKLRPQGKLIEMAVLNLPSVKAPAADATPALPTRGQHFELYYDLVTNPPAKERRPIPDISQKLSASEPQVDWGSLHPRNAMWSDLLDRLGMAPRGKRGPYDLALCPMTTVP